jgi:hypothetical protein
LRGPDQYPLNHALVIELLVGASIILFGVFSLLVEWRKHKRATAHGG